MPKVIARPQIGQIDTLQFNEVINATKLLQSWEQSMSKLNSPNKGVMHKQPILMPEFPKFQKVKLHQASILPMLGGKTNIHIQLELTFNSVNRKDLAGYFINQTVEMIVFGAEKMKYHLIIETLKAAASAAGPNTMIYQEIMDVINSMKIAAAKLELTADGVWKLVTSINTKVRTDNQCLKEFMLNLKKLGVLDYLIPITEHERSTKGLFQGEVFINYDQYLSNIENKFPKASAFKDKQKSFLLLDSKEKTIYVFEINLNG